MFASGELGQKSGSVLPRKDQRMMENEELHNLDPTIKTASKAHKDV